VKGLFRAGLLALALAAGCKKGDEAKAAYQTGFAHQMKGEYDAALHDYDRALAVKPDLALALKNRGRTHFYLGHYGESARDLADGLRYDSTNGFVVVWLHMAEALQGKADSAQLATNVARLNPAKWPAPVAKLYLGKSSIAALDSVAEVGDARALEVQRCGAAFYVGVMQLWSKQTAEARTRLERARAICPHDWSEYQGAVAELGRLGAT
jgi:lipoprotein NlpI